MPQAPPFFDKLDLAHLWTSNDSSERLGHPSRKLQIADWALYFVYPSPKADIFQDKTWICRAKFIYHPDPLLGVIPRVTVFRWGSHSVLHRSAPGAFIDFIYPLHFEYFFLLDSSVFVRSLELPDLLTTVSTSGIVRGNSPALFDSLQPARTYEWVCPWTFALWPIVFPF